LKIKILIERERKKIELTSVGDDDDRVMDAPYGAYFVAYCREQF
jgi:hypothetical protein